MNIDIVEPSDNCTFCSKCGIVGGGKTCALVDANLAIVRCMTVIVEVREKKA